MSLPTFPLQFSLVIGRIDQVDPVRYARTRNFSGGAVTYLSPYLSRGLITLPFVVKHLSNKGFKPYAMTKFLQELAWREYFQRVWWHLGERLFRDIHQAQPDVGHYAMPLAVMEAKTGISGVDEGIRGLYANGYLHNHLRMYLASICCNIGRAHWELPSRWMYYHLLDGDLASNTCSWQWVAGSFSVKKYFANQENINKYLGTNDRGTFLDRGYEELPEMPVPDILRQTTTPDLAVHLPKADPPFTFQPNLPFLLYHSYHLDPSWRANEAANRVLVIEPSHFSRFPVSPRVLDFIVALAKENIPGIQVYVGEVSEMPGITGAGQVVTREHPLASHFPGSKDPYPWLFPQVDGYYPSFSAYWKRAERELKNLSR